MTTAQSELDSPIEDVSTVDSVRDYEEIPSTKALSIRADWLRTDVDMLHDDVRDLHEQTRTLDLAERAYEKATGRDVPALLTELADSRGMSWSDIAAAAGVSVSAIRKWRNGGSATADNRTRLGQIAALLDLLEEKDVSDPAQWLEMKLPLPSGYLIRPLDLYLAGQAECLIGLAEHREDAEQVLDRAMPGWRDLRSGFEVVTDTDGARTIRMRGK